MRIGFRSAGFVHVGRCGILFPRFSNSDVMMRKAFLEPTADQTFEVVGDGPYNFV